MSRAAATALSDWDLHVEGERQGMMDEIPAVVASFGPLAAFWEPLSEQAGYMAVMNGPTKLDVFPVGALGRSLSAWRETQARRWRWLEHALLPNREGASADR